MIDWDKEYKRLDKQDECPECGEQKKTVTTGLDWSACPKSLPVSTTDKGCKNEGCTQFIEGKVW